MKSKILLVGAFFCLLPIVRSQNWDWAITANQYRTDIGKNIAVDKFKNSYVTGLATNMSNRDFVSKEFIWKFDSAGTLLWKQELDNSLNNSKMVCDPLGNIYVAAGMSLVRYDTTGQKLWHISRSEDNGQFAGLCQHPAGGVILYGARVTDDLSTRGFITRYDKNGLCLWTKYSPLIGTAIGNDPEGNVYLAGVRAPEASSLNSGFIAVFTDEGVLLHTATVPQTPTSIVLDQQKNIYLAGSYNRMQPIKIDNQIYTMQGEALSYFIIKYDQNFSVLWHKILTGSLWGGWLETDLQSNLYFTISADQSLSINGQSIPAGKLGFFIMKCNPAGQIIYSSFSYSGENPDGGGTANAWDFCLDHDNNIYFTGSTTGNHFFGTHETICDNSYSDLFVAKISQVTNNHVKLAEESKSSILKIEVFPNPSGDIFVLQSNLKERAIASIVDVNGRMLRVLELNLQVNNNIDLTNYVSGVYFLQIKTKDKVETKKLIKN